MPVYLSLTAWLLCAMPVHCQSHEKAAGEPGRTELEVQRWNQILTADKPSFNTNPNAFLVEMVRDRKPGAVVTVSPGAA